MTRQREIFVALMENQEMQQDLLNEQMVSGGLAMDRYNDYLQSVEASQEKMNAAWEEFVSILIESGTIKFFYDLGTGIIEFVSSLSRLQIGFGEVKGTMNLLIPILMMVASQFIAVNRSMLFGGIGSYISSMTAAGQATATAGAAAQTASASFNLVALAIAAVVAVLYTYNEQVIKTNQQGINTNKELWQQIQKESKTSEQAVRKYREEIERTNKILKDSGAVGIFIDKQGLMRNGLEETSKVLIETSKDYEDYVNNIAKLYEASGYTENEAMTNAILDMSEAEYKAYKNAQYLAEEGKRVESTLWTMKKTTKETAKEVFSLADELLKLSDLAKKPIEILAKVKKEGFQAEDIGSLKELPGFDYNKALKMEGNQIELNTQMLRDYALAQIDAEIANAESSGQNTEALKAYRQELINNMSVTKDFTDNFNEMMAHSVEAFDDPVLKEGFKNQAKDLYELNQLYENGLLTENEYFASVNENLANMDFQETFKGNQEAAQIFYAGLAQNSMAAFAQITTDFNNGEINANEYSYKLQELANVFLQLGDMSVNFASFLGMDSAAATAFGESINSSLGIIRNAQAGLQSMQAMNEQIGVSLQNLAQNNMQWGTAEYNQRMQQIASLAAASGQVFTDTEGKALKSEADIYKYLTGSTSNFKNFAQQATNVLGGYLTQIRTGIGQMLVQIGGAIKTMKFNITITPKLGGMVDFAANILGSMMGNAIQLPAISLEVGGAEGVGAAIESFGQGLINAPPIQLDMGSLFETGSLGSSGGLGGGSGGIGGLGQSIDNLKGSIDDMTGAMKKQQESLGTLLDMVIAKIKQEKEEQKEALKDQLKRFKENIEMRKKKLRLMKDEMEFEEKMKEQQEEKSNLQNKILELSLDDSEEAQARRRQLEEELAKKKEEIAKTQKERNWELQSQALDDEYKKFEKMIDAKIKKIDEFLSQAGTITQQAIDEINKGGEALYQELLEWNRKYGSGIDSTVKGAWEAAYAVLNKYRNELGQIDYETAFNKLNELMQRIQETQQAMNNLDTGGSGGMGGTGSGTGSGGGSAGGTSTFSGSGSLSDVPSLSSSNSPMLNSLYGGLKSFSNNPSMTSNAGVSFDKVMEINVAGNLDKSVVPSLDKLADKVIAKINDTMGLRGFHRLTNQYSAS